MNRQSFALYAAISLLAGGPAAWSPASADDTLASDEIVVLFERPTVKAEPPVTTSEGKSATGMPIVQTEIRHRIRFDDLDLATEAGAAALVTRVRESARQGCAEIDKLFLPAVPNSDCKRKAVSEAMAQVNAAIAAAKAAPAQGGAR